MDAFKLPPVTGKRKLPEEPTDVLLKRYRVDDGSSRERTRIEDVDEGAEEDYEPAGPELPPIDDAEDEEGGRMYGGGVTAEMQRVFEVVDQLDEDKPPKMDSAQLRKIVLKFERVLEKNQELRMKYADEPMKFLESESDLDAEVRNLMALTSAPNLYPELIRLGAVGSILSLLSHENTDVVLSTIELLNELTDEEIVPEEDGEAEEQGVKELVKALEEAQALELVVQNLVRFDETKDDDRRGVFNVLGFIENVIAVDSEASRIIVDKTEILPFLLRRIQASGIDSNKQYASEMLAILLQSDLPNRTAFVNRDGMDVLLQCLARFRNKDPKEDDEVEFMENLFDVVCAVLQEEKGKQKFLEGEGLELMLIMLKAKQMARMRALKVVDYATTGSDQVTTQLCRRWVEILGLKTLFSVFMRKGTKSLRKQYKTWSEVEEDEHSIAVIASLFANLFEEAEDLRARLIGKFEEEQFEKVDRLVEMWDTYSARVRRAEEELASEELELDEDDILARKLEGGLFTLQQCAKVVGHLARAKAEHPGPVNHLLELFGRRKLSLDHVAAVLKDLADQLEGGERAKIVLLHESVSDV